MIDDALLKYADRVPRYTSYPTAPHFTESVDGTRYRQWLNGVGAKAPLSLYGHIPFCSSLCWFCGCQTTVVNRYEPVAAYLELLYGELKLIRGALGPNRPVAHVHFGGGTPNILRSDDLQRLMEAIGDCFDITAGAEIALEIDPRTFTPDHAKALQRIGVNRASVGVQDFYPDIQHAINRVQSYRMTHDVVQSLRSHGVRAINIDLMYGLPDQTPDGIAETVDQTMDLMPDRVALFGYAHVPWMRPHQALIDADRLPDARTRVGLYRVAAARLADHGCVAIGIDHFARASDPLAVAQRRGALHRNFQGYTTDAAVALIGFGASAIGSLLQGYVQNAPSVAEYRNRIRAGDFATVKGIAIDDNDRLRRIVIERLMCDLTVDLADAAAQFQRDSSLFEGSIVALAPFEEDGLVKISGDQISIDPDARLIVRNVCAAFDAYRDTGRGRYSAAI